MKQAGSVNHACHLYHGQNGRKDVALPFIREGLLSGECCIFVSEAASVDDWYAELQRDGIDVPCARRDGTLDVVSSTTWREQCHNGSISMARDVLAVLSHKLREFPAIRVAGDADWSRDPEIPAEMLCHWEATANLVFDGFRAQVICQYDIDQYPPAFIIAALRTHPVVIYDGRQLANPFYEAQRILMDEPTFNHNSNDPDAVARMLGQLQPSNQPGEVSREVAGAFGPVRFRSISA